MAWFRLKRWARIAGVALPLLAMPGLAASAQAADSLYEVAKISVDITAKDAVAARDEGMAEAQMRAIKTVLQRLLPLSAQDQIPEFSPEDVEGLVNGVSIRSEQNSMTRYIATLDVSVNEPGIKKLLQDQAIPYSEARAPSISILPLVIAGNSVKSEGGEGWRQAFEQLDLAHSATPATVLRPRPGLSLETVKAVLAGDAQALATLQADYGYGPLVLAVGEAAKGEFVTRLAGTDSVGAINFGRSDKLSADTQTIAREAAAIAFGIIENRWKVSQAPESPATEVKYEEGTGDARLGARRRAQGRSAPQCRGPGRVLEPQGLAGYSRAADERRRNRGARGQYALGAGGPGDLRLCGLARPPSAGSRSKRL